ncbi:MAG: DUF4190 domain-containing protein [Geminicoccaceae bacterium]
MRANRTIASGPCSYCADELGMGRQIARCEACGALHHAECWQEHDGCSGAQDCVNRPFEQGPVDSQQQELAPNEFRCPQCRAVQIKGTFLCTACKRPTSHSGEYEGPMKMADGAIRSIVLGVIGLFFLGVIFGPLAISAGNKAREAIRQDVTLKGDAQALSGIVLGWIALGGFIIGILALCTSSV